MHPCPVCLASPTRAFFEMRDVPVREGYLARDRNEALNCLLGNIVLHFCPSCGHIWNDEFDSARLEFDPQYDVSMFHSAAYRAYIDAAIERLKSRYGLAGKAALEIACGKGDFLRALVAHGFSQVYGFDPTFAESSLSAADRRHITAHRAYYDESYRSLRVGLVACRSALQYFRHPRPFLESIHRTLAEQQDAIVYFEVPNGDETFARRNVWNIAYEVGCFFSPTSLARLFRETGFDALDILPGMNGSQLEIEARRGTRLAPTRFESHAAIGAIADDVDSFARLREARVRDWTERLARAAAGRGVALWGAGHRAISFLSSIPDVSSIRAAVDINPARQGRYLPKVGVPVIAPEQLPSLGVDLVVATNPNFAAEIRAQMQALGLACDFDVLQ
jgi:SAM-dependent methyltransferase